MYTNPNWIRKRLKIAVAKERKEGSDTASHKSVKWEKKAEKKIFWIFAIASKAFSFACSGDLRCWVVKTHREVGGVKSINKTIISDDYTTHIFGERQAHSGADSSSIDFTFSRFIYKKKKKMRGIETHQWTGYDWGLTSEKEPNE